MTAVGRLPTDWPLFPVDPMETLEPGGSQGLRPQTFSASFLSCSAFGHAFCIGCRRVGISSFSLLIIAHDVT
jgi:hypothetical protein